MAVVVGFRPAPIRPDRVVVDPVYLCAFTNQLTRLITYALDGPRPRLLTDQPLQQGIGQERKTTGLDQMLRPAATD
jgi:hypothetical protein